MSEPILRERNTGPGAGFAPGSGVGSSAASSSATPGAFSNQNSENPAADLSELLGDVTSLWAGLTETQRQTGAIVALVSIFILRNYMMSMVCIGVVGYYLSLRKPKPDTFRTFFEGRSYLYLVYILIRVLTI